MEVIDGGITSPLGFMAAGVHCGIKKRRKDLAMIYSEKPAVVSIAYTQNRVKGAPLLVMMDRDPEELQAFVINSGNANTLTGERGIRDAEQMISLAASRLELDEGLVGVASTGIIGRFMPMEKVERGIVQACNGLGRGRKNDIEAANAILTTDTVIKEAACKVRLQDGTPVTVAGMAKGSGMISPAMKVMHATTLSFISTDAKLNPGFGDQWQEILDSSLNQVDVDGDQSTNDMSVIMANGVAGGSPANDDPLFWNAVRYVTQKLAKKIAMDGEGATKLISVTVKGARTLEDARLAARAVVSSNLVKAAIFGCDPNYGRILAAIGYSGADIDPYRVRLSMGANGKSIVIYEKGEPLIQTCGPGEAVLRELLKNKEISIVLDLGLGIHSSKAWGCDLSYEYVRINAEYTT